MNECMTGILAEETINCWGFLFVSKSIWGSLSKHSERLLETEEKNKMSPPSWSHSCLKKHGGADGIWLDEEQMLVCCLALCKHLSLLVCSPLPNEGAFDVSENQIILFVGFSLDNYPRNVLTIATWNNNKVSTHNFFLSLLMPGEGGKKEWIPGNYQTASLSLDCLVIYTQSPLFLFALQFRCLEDAGNEMQHCWIYVASCVIKHWE